MEDEEIIELLDQKLGERFRQISLHLERLKEEFAFARMHFSFHETQLENLKDELTLPSGKVTQRFAALEKRIEQLGGQGDQSRHDEQARPRISDR